MELHNRQNYDVCTNRWRMLELHKLVYSTTGNWRERTLKQIMWIDG